MFLLQLVVEKLKNIVVWDRTAEKDLNAEYLLEYKNKQSCLISQ